MPFQPHHRNASDRHATVRDQYTRVAGLTDTCIDDLLPDTYHRHLTKADEFGAFIGSKQTTTEPFDTEFIITHDSAQWGRKLSALVRDKATAQIIGTLSYLPEAIRDSANVALVGAEAFNNTQRALQADKRVEAFTETLSTYVEEVSKLHTSADHQTTVRALLEAYQQAAEHALWLDLAVPNDPAYLAALWVDPGHIEPLVTEVHTNQRDEVTRRVSLFTDEDTSAHHAAAEWLDIYGNDTDTVEGKRFSPSRMRADGIPSGDRAVSYLALEAIPGVRLNVARTWEELERRAESFRNVNQTATTRIKASA